MDFDSLVDKALEIAKAYGQKRQEERIELKRMEIEGALTSEQLRSDATKYNADSHLSGTKYAADKQFELGMSRKDADERMNQYRADKAFAASQYEADSRLTGTKYASDNTTKAALAQTEMLGNSYARQNDIAAAGKLNDVFEFHQKTGGKQTERIVERNLFSPDKTELVYEAPSVTESGSAARSLLGIASPLSASPAAGLKLDGAPSPLSPAPNVSTPSNSLFPSHSLQPMSNNDIFSAVVSSMKRQPLSSQILGDEVDPLKPVVSAAKHGISKFGSDLASGVSNAFSKVGSSLASDFDNTFTSINDNLKQRKPGSSFFGADDEERRSINR